jgi:uncharacterized membrane protein
MLRTELEVRSMHTVVLFAAAFLAAAVEMVEALTIVLAVGVTRGWRAAASGVLVALVALTFIIAVFGQAITRLPIDTLRLVVGTVLLVFGLQWLRKAILRASGLKALHDEDAIFRNEIDALQHTRVRIGTASPSRSRACSWKGSRSRSW